jgi:hypothetical protein
VAPIGKRAFGIKDEYVRHSRTGKDVQIEKFLIIGRDTSHTVDWVRLTEATGFAVRFSRTGKDIQLAIPPKSADR